MEITLDFRPVRFASETLPVRDRLPAWRDFYGPRINGADVEPAPDAPFLADVTLRALPGFGLTTTRSSPARFARTRRFLADGRDHFGLHLTFAGDTASQRGREIVCGPHDAVLMDVAEAGWIASAHPMWFWGLWFRRADLAQLVAGLDGRVLQPLAPDAEPVRYLVGYIRFLTEQQAVTDPGLARTAATHLRDLFALALGATRDAAALAEVRGLRAARLQAIKRHVGDNLGDPGLTVGAAAACCRVAPRYVQRLFENEGTTFSEYVLHQRLERALRMLSDPGFADWTVTAIALEAGFGDVSYFNRRFRRRYGMRPSDARQAVQRDA